MNNSPLISTAILAPIKEPKKVFVCDSEKMEICKNDIFLDLTNAEYHILEYLIKKSGYPVSREEILLNVDSIKYESNIKSIDVTSGFLEYDQNKLGAPQQHYSHWMAEVVNDEIAAGKQLAEELIQQRLNNQRQAQLQPHINVIGLAGDRMMSDQANQQCKVHRGSVYVVNK